MQIFAMWTEVLGRDDVLACRAPEGPAGGLRGPAAGGPDPPDRPEGGPDPDAAPGGRRRPGRGPDLPGLALRGQRQLAPASPGWVLLASSEVEPFWTQFESFGTKFEIKKSKFLVLGQIRKKNVQISTFFGQIQTF